MCGHGRKSDGMKTLNLGLDEVAHIRSALTKAELEGIDDAVREDVENGRVRKSHKCRLSCHKLINNVQLVNARHAT